MYKEIGRENEVLKIIACLLQISAIQIPQTKIMTKPVIIAEMDETTTTNAV